MKPCYMVEDYFPERYELKFYIDRDTYDVICDMIKPYVEYDPHSPSSQGYRYVIRSVYLDNELWDSYYEHLDGLEIRRKYRVRSYSCNEKSHFLEIKKKVNCAVVKKRKAISTATLDHLLDGTATGEHADKFLNNFCFLVAHLRLKPQLLIEYEREAYIGIEAARLRITFDRSVRAAACSEMLMYPEFAMWSDVLPDDVIILELKYDGAMPRFLREIIRSLNLVHEPISKYCAGIRVCNLV